MNEADPIRSAAVIVALAGVGIYAATKKLFGGPSRIMASDWAEHKTSESLFETVEDEIKKRRELQAS
jgi:hypothetical protein